MTPQFDAAWLREQQIKTELSRRRMVWAMAGKTYPEPTLEKVTADHDASEADFKRRQEERDQQDKICSWLESEGHDHFCAVNQTYRNKPCDCKKESYEPDYVEGERQLQEYKERYAHRDDQEELRDWRV